MGSIAIISPLLYLTSYLVKLSSFPITQRPNRSFDPFAYEKVLRGQDKKKVKPEELPVLQLPAEVSKTQKAAIMDMSNKDMTP